MSKEIELRNKSALAKSSKATLAEAVRRGESMADEIGDALLDYGRWLLVNVFADDTRAALEARNENTIWRELMRRAGGPTLRVSDRFIEVAVRIAAYDRRINDDNWRLLEPGRKELLLPLGREDTMRAAARQVVSMKMSQQATRALVRQTLAAQGKKVAVRTTPKRLRAHLSSFNTRFAAISAKDRLEAVFRRSKPEERAAIRKELQQMASFAKDALAKLKAHDRS